MNEDNETTQETKLPSIEPSECCLLCKGMFYPSEVATVADLGPVCGLCMDDGELD